MRDLLKAAVIGVLAMGFALGGAGAAFAQEDGVTLDPGDPAAKEYALPHEEARREAEGEGSAPVRQGSRDSALFGEGVGPDDASGDDASAGPSGSSGSGTSGDDATTTSPDDATTPATAPDDDPGPTTAGAAGAGPGDDGSGGPGAATVVIGGGVAVLLAALLGGFGLRALRSPQDA